MAAHTEGPGGTAPGAAWRRRAASGLAAVLLAGSLGSGGCVPHAPPPPAEPETPHPGPDARNGHSEEYLKGKEIGQEFVAQALHQFEFHTDYDTAGLVKRVGRRLVAATGADPDTYHFFVVKNPQANAFAIPGGYIFVFDGLLSRLRDEDELAGVLGHEIGHVRHGHFFKNQKQLAAADLAVIAAILLGQGGAAATSFSLAGAASLQLAYSRDNEREADQTAVDLLPKAGYDPRGLPDFFSILQRQERLLLPANQYPYLATHPGLDERLVRVRGLIEQSRAPVLKPPPKGPWERLEATLQADQVAQRPPQGGPLVEGLAYAKASRYQDARPLLEAAVRAAPGSAEAHTALGECLLAMGEVDAARKEAATALAADPRLVPALFLSGEVERRAGNARAAMQALLSTVTVAPGHPMAHFRLSQLFGQAGKTAEAQYHLARYLRLTLKPAQAYATLKGIETDDPALAKEVAREKAGLEAEGV
jgi:predicted Zn-dependent protease